MNWARIRGKMDLFVESLQVTFIRLKILLVLVFIFAVLAVIYCLGLFYTDILQKMFQNPTTVGVLGTLLGAIVGGFFSLVGSVTVSKSQQKAQTQIRRKNVIYKPLYDELVDIHNNILNRNPLPSRITFQKGVQTITPHPQYDAWIRIKSDTRYLETPQKLIRAMELLESNVKEYLNDIYKAEQTITELLNTVLLSEIECKCSIINVGSMLLADVVFERKFNLFEEIHDACTPKRDIDDATRERIQRIFLEKCESDSAIIQLKESYNTWLQTEGSVILLLGTMIQRINLQYEG